MPSDLLHALATLVVAGGLVAGAVVAAAARVPGEGLRCLLDFLLAAGLLRLAAGPTWESIAVAALTVVVRLLVSRSFRSAAAQRAPPAGPG